MSDLAVAAVEVLRVGLLEPLHKFGQGSGAGLKQQMDVVRHQTIGINSHVELRPVFLQPIKVGFVVIIGAKSFSSLVATHDNVIEQSGRKHSWTAGHEGRPIKNQSLLSRL